MLKGEGKVVTEAETAARTCCVSWELSCWERGGVRGGVTLSSRMLACWVIFNYNNNKKNK